MMEIPRATDSDLEWIRSNTALIEFFTETCVKCRALERVLQSILAELPNELHVRSVGLEESPGLAAEFSIQSAPTLLLIIEGHEVTRMLGVPRPQEILRHVTDQMATAGS